MPIDPISSRGPIPDLPHTDHGLELHADNGSSPVSRAHSRRVSPNGDGLIHPLYDRPDGPDSLSARLTTRNTVHKGKDTQRATREAPRE